MNDRAIAIDWLETSDNRELGTVIIMHRKHETGQTKMDQKLQLIMERAKQSQPCLGVTFTLRPVTP